MTDEQLFKGQSLKSNIEDIQSQIKLWENAVSVVEIKLNYNDGDRYRTTEVRYSNGFDELKELTLRNLKNRLERLEKEYREL